MDAVFPCPLCGAEQWRPLQSFRYSPTEHLQASSRLNDMQRLRRRILFEVWFPAAKEVTLRSQVCTACGFVTFAPRPGADDITAKYRFLQATERDIGGSGSPRAVALDRRRAEMTYEFVTQGLGRQPAQVLDFGGGNGKLLEPFVERGSDCVIVDYNRQPIAGVTRLGDTLDSIPAGERFEAIICSHVLEHMADPAGAIRRLSPHLTDDGALYSEVPVEIWKGIPIERDPVTHVNFFTAASLRELHLRNGMDVLEIRHRLGSYGEFRMEVAVVLARRRLGDPARSDGFSLDETMRRINPSPGARIWRAWRMRHLANRRRLAARAKRVILPR